MLRAIRNVHRFLEDKRSATPPTIFVSRYGTEVAVVNRPVVFTSCSCRLLSSSPVFSLFAPLVRCGCGCCCRSRYRSSSLPLPLPSSAGQDRRGRVLPRCVGRTCRSFKNQHSEKSHQQSRRVRKPTSKGWVGMYTLYYTAVTPLGLSVPRVQQTGSPFCLPPLPALSPRLRCFLSPPNLLQRLLLSITTTVTNEQLVDLPQGVVATFSLVPSSSPL